MSPSPPGPATFIPGSRLPARPDPARTRLHTDTHRQHRTGQRLAGQSPVPAAGLRVGAFAGGLDHPRWLLVLPNGDVPVAVVFYLLFALGLVIFAVAPHTAPHSWGTTLTLAALFGFFTYATYDLTNWATLKDWPWKLSLVDMAWGTLVSTASAAGGKAALDWAGRN